jgi:hypothetical protein
MKATPKTLLIITNPNLKTRAMVDRVAPSQSVATTPSVGFASGFYYSRFYFSNPLGLVSCSTI